MHQLALSPRLQIISQSLRDCSEDAGEVSSMYSTPNASSAFAILTLVSVSKKAFANYTSTVIIQPHFHSSVSHDLADLLSLT